MRHAAMLWLMVGTVALVGCGRGKLDQALEDTEEVAQALGDMMASADESSGENGGTFAFYKAGGVRRMMDTPLDRLQDAILPSAHAAACWGADTFGTCSNSTITRTFGGCTVGLASLTGTVTLTWTGGNCRLETVGESVTRVPNFTITGRRDATLTVSGAGQQLTRTGADAYTYHVSGVSRVLRTAAGATLADVDTRTTADVTVTGTSRASRVMNGGTFEVRHNVAKYTTTLSPANLTWTASCNCATSGSLTGTVTPDDGDAVDVTVTVTGCGTATITADDKSKEVTFDRCSGT
ncbi:MAG: hypothetical protein HY904_01630 [Deltaproteobacteria bacterium]|nr:hypothetical protein [Deltaproteobacteria bacterium]